MMRQKIHVGLTAVFIASFCAIPGALAGDQARTIVNGLDPKSMNELFEAMPTQPDAALTSIAPVSPNKFRFLFVWPATNGLMTYDRVGRSFAERFMAFAAQLKPLAKGYCLTSRNMFFGSASYGEEEVNVAYRDIEVRYQFGWQANCPGRYITALELDQLSTVPQAFSGGGYGAALPETPQLPSKEPSTPEDRLKPFLSAPAAPPLD